MTSGWVACYFTECLVLEQLLGLLAVFLGFSGRLSPCFAPLWLKLIGILGFPLVLVLG